MNNNSKYSKSANQAANKVSEAIPEEAKSYMRSAKEKILDSDNLRPFSVFVGIGEPSSFNVTLNPTVLCPRLKHNLFFFYLNYILLAAVVFVITLLATMLNPLTLIVVVALAAAWFVVIKATTEDVKFGCFTITRKNASLAMMIISGIVAFFTVKDTFFVTLGTGSALSLIHAIFRDSSKLKLAGETTDDKEEPFDEELA